MTAYLPTLAIVISVMFRGAFARTAIPLTMNIYWGGRENIYYYLFILLFHFRISRITWDDQIYSIPILPLNLSYRVIRTSYKIIFSKAVFYIHYQFDLRFWHIKHFSSFHQHRFIYHSSVCLFLWCSLGSSEMAAHETISSYGLALVFPGPIVSGVRLRFFDTVRILVSLEDLVIHTAIMNQTSRRRSLKVSE